MRNIRKSHKWLWSLVKEKKWFYLLGGILMILQTLSNVVLIGVKKWVIDIGIIEQQYDQLVVYFSILTIAAVGIPAFFTAVAMVQHYIGYSIRIDLQRKLMNHLHKLPTKEIHDTRVAQFVDYFTKDINQVGENIGYKIPQGFQFILETVVLVIIIGRINMIILVGASIFTFAYILLGKYLSKRVRDTSREVKDLASKLLIYMEEGISATREVMAFNREEWELARYNKNFFTYFKKTMKETRLMNKQLMLTEPINWGVTLLVLFIGGLSVMQGAISIGIFVVVFQYVNQLVRNYRRLFNYVMGLSRTFASVDRLDEVFAKDILREGNSVLKDDIDSLTFNKVSFKYDEETRFILNECSMTIPSGKKAAVVGYSGSGKSTLSKLILKQYEPVNGDIYINNIDLRNLSTEQWLSHIAIAFQEPYLFPDSIKNNILMGRKVEDEQLYSICKDMLIHDFIMDLPDQYETIIGERGINLSGGQRQRISLARAIISNPEILILDEATSALDMTTERSIQSNIDYLRKGKTTLIIAHRLSTIQNADLIYVLNNGKVIEEGTHEALMGEKSFYKHMIESQTEKKAG